MTSTDEQRPTRRASWHWGYVPLGAGAVLALVYGIVALFVLLSEANWLALTAIPLAYWVARGCVIRIRKLAATNSTPTE